MLSKILRIGIMLGIPLVLLAIFVIKPLINDGTSSLIGGEGLVVIEAGGEVITIEEARRMVAYVSTAQQEYLAASTENLQEFLLAKMTQKVMAGEALALNLEGKRETQWDLEETKRSILSTALIEEKRLNTEIPASMMEVAREYYLAHQEDFTEEGQIEVAHILFRNDGSQEADAEKRELAGQVLSEIQNGSSFEEAAKQYSEEGSTAAVGGALGLISRAQVVDEFGKAAFALKEKGDISGVVETEFGYHIIKLLADKPAQTVVPFEDLEEILVANERAKFLKVVLMEYAETFQRNDDKTVYVPALEQMLETMQADMSLSETATP